MSRNTTVEGYLNNDFILIATRILSTKIQWPAGEPPYDSGYATIPAISGEVIYDRDTFVDTDWTDCTALVNSPQYSKDINSLLGSLEFSTCEEWNRKDFDNAFKMMRVIVVQQKFTNTTTTTGWINVAFCISIGYKYKFNYETGTQNINVSALDVMMLADLNIVGESTGSAVYQPDKIQYGSYDTPLEIHLIGNAADAFEYGVPEKGGGIIDNIASLTITDNEKTFDASYVGKTVTVVLSTGNLTFTVTNYGTHTLTLNSVTGITSGDYYYVGEVQPNWCDNPGPRFWLANVPNETTDIPLLSVEEGVQAVFGAGMLRLGKNYVTATPESAGDYTQGLGYTAGTIPIVKAYLFRFAHETYGTLPSDIVENLTTDEEGTGYFHISDASLLDGINPKLSIVVTQSNKLYKATSFSTDGTGIKIYITNSGTTIPAGTKFTYGYSNSATNLIKLLLAESGFNYVSGAYLSVATVKKPLIISDYISILVPPLVYNDEDDITRIKLIEELRGAYSVPPSYTVHSKADGKVYVENIKQKLDSVSGKNTSIIPVKYFQPDIIDRTDYSVHTKVIAYGLAKQITDVTQETSGGNYVTTITDVATIDGGLPTPTYTLTGKAIRTSPTGSDYQFILEWLITRGRETTISGKKKRPWAWYYHALHDDSLSYYRKLKDQWIGADLCVIDFQSEKTIQSLELDVSNTWWIDKKDWGGDRHNSAYWTDENGEEKPAFAMPQLIDIDYYDSTLETWLPLVTNLFCKVETPNIITIESDDFVTKEAVTTQKLKIRCAQPFEALCNTKDENYNHYILGVWLNQIKVYGKETLRGTAEIGVTAPFDTTGWQNVKSEIRTRTLVVSGVADYADTQTKVNNLAKEWLYNETRELAPRSFSTFYPTIEVGDTIRCILPTGEMNLYYTAEDQLTNIKLYGVDFTNSDEGVLYYAVTNSGSTRTINIYKNSGRTQLVATGSKLGDGIITLSGEFTGEITITYSGNDTGVISMPTYLVVGVNNPFFGPQQLTVINYIDPFFEV